MEITIIVAVSKNLGIGKDGDIPWHLKGDFQYFKDTTMGHPCLMGDKTFDSLPDNARPLPGRENIILTLDKDYTAEGAKVFHSFEDAFDYCRSNGKEKVFICGGGTIYKIGMKYADTLLVTEIDKEFDADTFFPDYKDGNWELVNKEPTIEEEGVRYNFCTYKKK